MSLDKALKAFNKTAAALAIALDEANISFIDTTLYFDKPKLRAVHLSLRLDSMYSTTSRAAKEPQLDDTPDEPEEAPLEDEEAEDPTQDEEAEEIGFDDIIAALRALIKDQGKPAAFEILAKYKATKASDLKASQYAKVHADLTA